MRNDSEKNKLYEGLQGHIAKAEFRRRWAEEKLETAVKALNMVKDAYIYIYMLAFAKIVPRCHLGVSTSVAHVAAGHIAT